ncbi:hypothetical protein ACJJTC_001154 [Scirpophaga incertulas]
MKHRTGKRKPADRQVTCYNGEVTHAQRTTRRTRSHARVRYGLNRGIWKRARKQSQIKQKSFVAKVSIVNINVIVKMRAVVLLCACVCAAVGQSMNDYARMPKYDERYDYLDVDALFISKRLVKNYVDCLISAQRCTPEGKQLKRILPEALRTKCIRCTETQKKTAVKVIKRLKYEFPEEWAKLSSRWDPTGDFTRYFEVYLANEQFNTISGSAGNNEYSSSETPASIDPTPSLPPVPPRSPDLSSIATPAAPTLTPAQPTTPRPIILNRFGDDGELMVGSGSSAGLTPRPPTTRPAPSTNTINTTPTKPTNWVGAGSEAKPTRFPLRPTNEIPPPYTTAITLIDRIGYKIIRTTELVTDILKSTVRAVVGR